MFDALPQFQSMKRTHRVRKFRPGNIEHGRKPTKRKGKVHNPFAATHRHRQEIAA